MVHVYLWNFPHIEVFNSKETAITQFFIKEQKPQSGKSEGGVILLTVFENYGGGHWYPPKEDETFTGPWLVGAQILYAYSETLTLRDVRHHRKAIPVGYNARVVQVNARAPGQQKLHAAATSLQCQHCRSAPQWIREWSQCSWPGTKQSKIQHQ